MKSKGGTARAGDVVPYIFCLGSGGESSKTGQADRARHPDEVRKAEKDCQIGAMPDPSSDALVFKPDLFSRVTDYDYYLSQQILPPIERLCERIEGTDRSRLAECLGKPVFSGMSVVVIDQNCTSRVLRRTLYRIGLDPARFRSYSAAEGEDLSITTLDSQIPESQRYNNADPLKIRCRHCKTETDFVPIYDRQVRCDVIDTFGPHYLPVSISDVTEIPLITLRTDVPGLSQSSGERKYPSTTGETDPRAHLEVLSGMDRVRRFYVWEQDEDDECVWEAVFAARVHRSRNL